MYIMVMRIIFKEQLQLPTYSPLPFLFSLCFTHGQRSHTCSITGHSGKGQLNSTALIITQMPYFSLLIFLFVALGVGMSLLHWDERDSGKL